MQTLGALRKACTHLFEEAGLGVHAGWPGKLCMHNAYASTFSGAYSWLDEQILPKVHHTAP